MPTRTLILLKNRKKLCPQTPTLSLRHYSIPDCVFKCNRRFQVKYKNKDGIKLVTKITVAVVMDINYCNYDIMHYG